MAVSLKFNTEELAALNTEVKATKSSMFEIFGGMKNICSELSNDIQSDMLVSQIVEISDKVSGISTSIDNNLQLLVEYLDGQLAGYENLTQEAARLLEEALNFINENFGTVAA